MQLGRKLADGYAGDPELDDIAPPVVEVATDTARGLETVPVRLETEPARA